MGSVDDVIRVEEPDYRYGTGPPILRVTAIGEARGDTDGLWLKLRGHDVRWNGEADPSERHALVRLEAVRLVPSRKNRDPPLPRRIGAESAGSRASGLDQHITSIDGRGIHREAMEPCMSRTEAEQSPYGTGACPSELRGERFMPPDYGAASPRSSSRQSTGTQPRPEPLNPASQPNPGQSRTPLAPR